ncbi:hypothetical protein [Pseudomonas entomophila]|uniref:hypothetical protein n=1 Tax=Pseudomonas entomophila TaxID=312306 RepID=UPI00200F2825|nr:hypothetical protein [Pseudomonas entomophila]
MLNGIGGRTISEAKERLSYVEVRAWALYIQRHGSLHGGRRLEASIAMLALQANHHVGGTAELIDFMPHERRQGVSLESAMQQWC